MKTGILPILLGLVAAIASTFLVESLGHLVYPPPTNVDFDNEAAVKLYMEVIPLGALIFVVLAWIVGGFCGGVITTLLNPIQGRRNALIIGGVVLLFSIMTMAVIPHPLWMWVCACLSIIPVTVLGNKVALMRQGGV